MIKINQNKPELIKITTPDLQQDNSLLLLVILMRSATSTWPAEPLHTGWVPLCWIWLAPSHPLDLGFKVTFSWGSPWFPCLQDTDTVLYSDFCLFCVVLNTIANLLTCWFKKGLSSQEDWNLFKSGILFLMFTLITPRVSNEAGPAHRCPRNMHLN